MMISISVGLWTLKQRVGFSVCFPLIKAATCRARKGPRSATGQTSRGKAWQMRGGGMMVGSCFGGGNSLHSPKPSTFHLSNLLFIHLKIQWLERNHGGLVQMVFLFMSGWFLRFHDIPATNFPGKNTLNKKYHPFYKLTFSSWKYTLGNCRNIYLHNLQMLSNFLVPCYCRWKKSPTTTWDVFKFYK